ncbi:hypothetical protein [Bordetella bronchiseptica]|uniref:hypothetical protein n=1 Tax=Bordetella bronchiseptica TaxID=518 RepID=UPI001E4DA5D0|nr:hypothetical protein [Bordetella bronchiseptica]
MKFLTFSVQEQSRLGMLLDENRVLDLTALLAARPDLGLPGALRNVGELIALGEEALARLREPGLLDGVDVGALPTLQAVRVLPPCPWRAMCSAWGAITANTSSKETWRAAGPPTVFPRPSNSSPRRPPPSSAMAATSSAMPA